MEDFSFYGGNPLLSLPTVAEPPQGPFIDQQGRDLLVRTVIGEAENQPDIGQAGVAHVVMNRLSSGKWGKSIPDVLFAPKQFEPWSTRRDELLSIPQDDPRYQRAASIVDAALGGKLPDPTKGATHFANAELVEQRGNDSGMAWINQIRANGTGSQIGNHYFGNPDLVQPANATGPQSASGQPLRPFFKPAPGLAVRPGVDMAGLLDGAKGVFDSVARLNIPGLEVVSGYRDPSRNARAGGAKGSQHLHGNAFDINIEKLSEEDRTRVMQAAIASGAKGVGIYPGGRSLHFDVRETPTRLGRQSRSPL